MKKTPSMPVLSPYHLVALSLVAIINLREYPLLASMGWQALTYALLAFFGFLLPSAWVCAQLAARYPSQGGLYTWFQQAFGDTFGCLGMAVEWLNNLISFPATLAMMVATIMTVIFPSWQQHTLIFALFSVVLCWFCILLCSCGLRTTNRVNVLASLLGIVMPTLLVISLGLYWVITRHPIALSSPRLAAPAISLFHLGLFVSVLSAFAGMQSSAFFASRVINPQKAYPKALLSSAIIIFFLTTGAALAIAVVVPASSINYINGLIASFEAFFTPFHLAWVSPWIALLMVLGALAAVCAWMLALARGIHQMAVEGKVPAYFSKLSAREVPLRILLLQGLVVSLLIGAFACVPDAQTVYWLFVLLTSQFTVLLYIGLFVAAIKLLCRDSVIWKRVITRVLAGFGILSSVAGLCASYSRPGHIVWTEKTYAWVVASSDVMIVILLLLFLILRLRSAPFGRR